MSKVRVVTPDNHYFEVVEFTECGHRVRMFTEDIQWGSQTAQSRKHRRRHLAERGCQQCREQEQ